jgi:hypothetical protein
MERCVLYRLIVRETAVVCSATLPVPAVACRPSLARVAAIAPADALLAALQPSALLTPGGRSRGVSYSTSWTALRCRWALLWPRLHLISGLQWWNSTSPPTAATGATGVDGRTTPQAVTPATSRGMDWRALEAMTHLTGTC